MEVRRAVRAGSLLFAMAILTAGAAWATLNPQEELGKRIFRSGEGTGGREIKAALGAEGVETTAAALPCAGCHGRDGRGRPEGGVAPPDVTWGALTRPYSIAPSGSRRHPPYSERLAKRAVTLGLDAAGNPLDRAMPRYRLTQEEAAALVGYLKRLELERDPGIADGALRLGIVLPPAGTPAAMSDAIRRTLEAAAHRVGERGGLYGRRLELRFLAPPEPAAERRAALASFLDGEEVFALLAPFLVGAEAELASLAREREIPAVGPFTIHPETGSPLNRWVFYFLPGLEEQARALADFALERERRERPGARAVVARPRGELAEVAAAIRDQTSRQGDAATAAMEITEVEYPPGDPNPAVAAAVGAGALFFLGDAADSRAILTALAAAGSPPDLFLLGALAGSAASPPGLAGRVFFALPTLPSDLTARGAELYRQLGPGFESPPRPPSVQLAALAAAETLFDALERAGRDLSREKLVAALEGLNAYDTGLTPPLTFGPNRRLGALGAYVVTPDRDGNLVTASGWITPR